MKKIKNYIHLRAVDLSRYLSAATVSWKRKQQILFISITTFVFLGLSLLAITSAFTSR